MKRAVIYARYSSKLQKERSLEGQIADCENLAAREKMKVVKIYKDAAKTSATMFDRDGLLACLSDAEAGKFDVLIAESLDRISSNRADLSLIWEKLEYREITLITITDGVTTEQHIGVRGITGPARLDGIRVGVRRGQRLFVRNGKIPAGLHYGHRRIAIMGGWKTGEREIDPEQAAVILRIFTEYAAGRSPRTICLGLSADGIPAPKGGAHWNHESLIGSKLRRGILQNPIYIGELHWHLSRTKRKHGTGKRNKFPGREEDKLMTPVPHLRIIPQDLWDRCQAIRRERAVQKFGPTGTFERRSVVSRGDYLLAGLLKCEACNGTMRICQGNQQGRRVSCAAAHQHGTCTHRKSYDLAKLERDVIDNLRNKLIDPDLLAEHARAYHERRAEREKRNGTEITSAQKRLGRIQVQIDRLVAAVRDSDQPVPELVAQINSLSMERGHLNERLRLLQAEEISVIRLHPDIVNRWRRNVEELHEALTAPDITAERRAAARLAFRNIIDSIVVHETPKHAPYEHTPYSRLAALMGVDMFPARRQASEILAAQGVTNADNGNHRNLSRPLSASVEVISLGRWRGKVAA